MGERKIKDVDLLLMSGKSVLLAGAPGVGKTRSARRIARKYTGIEPVLVVGRGDLSYDHLVSVSYTHLTLPTN